jgi:hypothetical protein
VQGGERGAGVRRGRKAAHVSPKLVAITRDEAHQIRRLLVRYRLRITSLRLRVVRHRLVRHRLVSHRLVGGLRVRRFAISAASRLCPFPPLEVPHGPIHDG